MKYVYIHPCVTANVYLYPIELWLPRSVVSQGWLVVYIATNQSLASVVDKDLNGGIRNVPYVLDNTTHIQHTPPNQLLSPLVIIMLNNSSYINFHHLQYYRIHFQSPSHLMICIVMINLLLMIFCSLINANKVELHFVDIHEKCTSTLEKFPCEYYIPLFIIKIWDEYLPSKPEMSIMMGNDLLIPLVDFHNTVLSV